MKTDVHPKYDDQSRLLLRQRLHDARRSRMPSTISATSATRFHRQAEARRLGGAERFNKRYGARKGK